MTQRLYRKVFFTTLSVAGVFVTGTISASAQVLNSPTVFNSPGTYTYTVPAGAGSLKVEIKGAAGGAGGWDDANGGDGAGGSIVTANITVVGGETVALIVGDGGQGARGYPNFGVGGVGGGAAASLLGAGGNGGQKGATGSSPGGAGGGGASSLKISGAVVLAGGGGAGGSNSVVRGPDGNWNYPAAAAVNNLLMNQQDAQCATPAVGGNGQDAGTGVDGSGGGGGGGGYDGHAGIGGAHGIDRVALMNSQPGTSGGSCTLNAGEYRITDVIMAVGASAPSNKTQKGTNEASGEAGRISIIAVPAPVANVKPVPSLDTWALLALSTIIGMFGLMRSRRRQS